jgi:hypothetical protein
VTTGWGYWRAFFCFSNRCFSASRHFSACLRRSRALLPVARSQASSAITSWGPPIALSVVAAYPVGQEHRHRGRIPWCTDHRDQLESGIADYAVLSRESADGSVMEPAPVRVHQA